MWLKRCDARFQHGDSGDFWSDEYGGATVEGFPRQVSDVINTQADNHIARYAVSKRIGNQADMHPGIKQTMADFSAFTMDKQINRDR